METKKEILKWWEDLGKKTKDINDYQDFWEKIDEKSLAISEKVLKQEGLQEHEITIIRHSWKYPIKLYFYDLECYRIVDF